MFEKFCWVINYKAKIADEPLIKPKTNEAIPKQYYFACNCQAL